MQSTQRRPARSRLRKSAAAGHYISTQAAALIPQPLALRHRPCGRRGARASVSSPAVASGHQRLGSVLLSQGRHTNAALFARLSELINKEKPYMIDFEIPAEAKEVRERVRKFVQEECIPAEKQLEDAALQGSARRTAREGARAGPLVPVHPAGIRRHGPRPAGQRARADGARRELPRRARAEHAGPRRRDDAHAARRTARRSRRRSSSSRCSTARSASATR